MPLNLPPLPANSNNCRTSPRKSFLIRPWHVYCYFSIQEIVQFFHLCSIIIIIMFRIHIMSCGYSTSNRVHCLRFLFYSKLQITLTAQNHHEIRTFYITSNGNKYMYS